MVLAGPGRGAADGNKGAGALLASSGQVTPAQR